MAETTSELATKIYSLVEAVKVDGKLRKGANETTKSIERGEAKLVIIASDVNPPEITAHFEVLCKERDIPFVHVPARTELGAAAGLLVGTSAVAIALAGDAKRRLDEVLDDIKALEKRGPEVEKPEEKPKEEKKEEEIKPEKEEKPKEKLEKKKEKVKGEEAEPRAPKEEIKEKKKEKDKKLDKKEPEKK